MSYTFDQMQYALQELERYLNAQEPTPKRNQLLDAIFYLGKTIDAIHNLDHSLGGTVNRSPSVYRQVKLLEICLEYTDAEERRRKLKMMEGVTCVNS